MPGSDSLALLVCQRVEHAVVWVDGRQTVLGQLTLYDLDQFLHAVVVVRPVAHNLQRHQTMMISVKRVQVCLVCSAVSSQLDRPLQACQDVK